jgi:hypothetical protein
VSIKSSIVCIGIALISTFASAQQPTVTVDPQQHGNLAAAQQSIVQAWGMISAAQRDNDAHLGGHAQRAKDLLNEANQEIQLAADQANANAQESLPTGPPPSVATPANTAPPVSTNITGNWTIFAYNVDQPGSSLKTVTISQNGNILSGTFRGPHQRGKLQGWVSGNHVEFSTDTHDVLTFRGEVTADGMSGMYGVHGQHAPWKAERTN